MAGRSSDERGAGTVPGQSRMDAEPAPGGGHFPLPTDRLERLQVLADLARRGLYHPDSERLAKALLDKVPDLFCPDKMGAGPCPKPWERGKPGERGKDGAKGDQGEVPARGDNGR